MTPEEAISILNEKSSEHKNLENNLLSERPKGIFNCWMARVNRSTISDTISEMKNEGFDAFKMKIGQDINHDIERLTFYKATNW